jgi:hypothetical protein
MFVFPFGDYFIVFTTSNGAFSIPVKRLCLKGETGVDAVADGAIRGNNHNRFIDFLNL